MEKVYIEIDASPWMDAEGVLTSVWFGDACEPCFEQSFSYEELINKELGAHTACGTLSGDNIADAEKFVVVFEEAAKYARERFEELKGE